MQRVMIRIALALGRVATAALWLAGTALVAMTALITAHVIARYGLNSSIVWSEPAAVILMGWFIFLGAAVGIREGYHLSFDILIYLLPQRGKLVLFSLSDLAVGAFGCGMVWYGGQLAWSAAGVRLPTLGISGAFDFMPITMGGILVVIFSAERLACRAAGLPTARFGDQPEDRIEGRAA